MSGSAGAAGQPATSWIESANDPQGHYCVRNLPYGAFSRADEAARCCTAIGDRVLDLSVLEAAGLISAGAGTTVFGQPGLNAFMALGSEAWAAVRAQLSALLSGADSRLRDDKTLRARALTPLAEAKLHLPFTVAEYTDFYSSRQHAFNVGTMLRGPENALPPNWDHMPIAYNGRASTVVVSGTPIRRPLGQMMPKGLDAPVFGPSRRLDLELEMGTVIGLPSPMGQPLTVAQAEEMIFGYVILNDWSARDIQGWEYQPLGPFQAKAFGTTISAWVVTRAALEPFRVSAPAPRQPLLPYLADASPRNYDVELEISLRPEGAAEASVISRSNFRHLSYSPAQQLCHHALCGCAMRSGDLLGSGTISAPDKGGYGSLLELSWGGKEPLTLAGGATRSFIEDGDTLALNGWAQGDGYRIGFGDCSGQILPAVTDWPQVSREETTS